MGVYCNLYHTLSLIIGTWVPNKEVFLVINSQGILINIMVFSHENECDSVPSGGQIIFDVESKMLLAFVLVR